MKAFVVAFLGVVAALLPTAPVLADSVSAPPSSVQVGQQFTLVMTVDAPAGAEVEVNTVADSWGNVEVIAIDTHRVEAADEGERHTFTLTVAAFAPGDLQFAPEAFVTMAGISTVREFPPAPLVVTSSLQPGAPLQLSPLGMPGRVGGARSPFLIPAIVGATGLAVALVLAVAAWGVRWLARRPRPAAEPAIPVSSTSPLAGIEDQLVDNPVAAYRVMATSVRAALASQYGFPARALTTHELQRRMEAEGVDRWQSRLVRGLLDECDQVIYAGYRPAQERRNADLGMARELLEGGD